MRCKLRKKYSEDVRHGYTIVLQKKCLFRIKSGDIMEKGSERGVPNI